MIVFRVVAGVLIAGALIHVSTVWPRVIALVSALDVRVAAWLVAGGFAVSALTALVACALAVFLLWKVADRPGARALVLFLAFLAIFWGSLFHFVEATAGPGELNVSLSYGGGWVSRSASIALMLTAAAFVRFSALFPRPLAADRLRPARWFRRLRSIRIAFLHAPAVWGSAIGALVLVEGAPALASRLLGPAPTEGGATVVPVVALGGAALTYLILPLAALVLGTRNLRASYRTAIDDERSRILWVVAGFSAASWLILCALGLLGGIVVLDLDVGILAAAIPLAIFIAPLVLVVCAAIGILRSGALDPALVLQRSTFYGPLGALGVVAFAGLESALSAWVEERLGLPGIAGSVLAGAMVAAAFIPLRAPLKRVGVKYVRRLANLDETPRSNAETQLEALSQPTLSRSTLGGPGS